MALSPIRDLEISLIRTMQHFYGENYRTFLKNMEKKKKKPERHKHVPSRKTQCCIVVQYLKFTLSSQCNLSSNTNRIFYGI